MDYFLFQQINNLAGDYIFLDTLAIFFAKYFGYILMALVILVPFFYKKVGWKIIFQSFLATILARFGIVELIRFLWEHPRPFVENNVNLLLEHSATSSFPSGHAAFFFALSAVVYFYNKKTGLFFFMASFLISIARVFSGVHWPSDIIAGALIGIFSGWLVMKIFKKT